MSYNTCYVHKYNTHVKYKISNLQYTQHTVHSTYIPKNQLQTLHSTHCPNYAKHTPQSILHTQVI